MQELIRADSCYCCFLSDPRQHAFPYRKYMLKLGLFAGGRALAVSSGHVSEEKTN